MPWRINRGRALSQLADILAGRAPRSPDWRSVLALAGEQLLAPQLSERLREARFAAPEDVLSYLAEARRRTLARNARLYGTLKEAVSALNGAGIEPVLLKGCALWALASDVATAPPESDRLISDLDLLVRPDEMQLAIDQLARAGFVVLEDDREARPHDVVVLGRAADVGAIDLHQHAPGPPGVEVLDDLHAHARPAELAGGVVRIPSPELQILTTAAHDQLHDAYFWRGGFDVRHLLDVAAIAEGPVDWSKLDAMCGAPLVRAAVAAQLQAARRIAGARIPDGMLAGGWGALHYWRQRMQFVWPWTNAIFDFTRKLAVRRWLWSWLVRRAADSVRSRSAAGVAI